MEYGLVLFSTVSYPPVLVAWHTGDRTHTTSGRYARSVLLATDGGVWRWASSAIGWPGSGWVGCPVHGSTATVEESLTVAHLLWAWLILSLRAAVVATLEAAVVGTACSRVSPLVIGQRVTASKPPTGSWYERLHCSLNMNGGLYAHGLDDCSIQCCDSSPERG